MSDANAMAEARARMLAAGADKDDLAWLDAMGWNDSTPPKWRAEAILAIRSGGWRRQGQPGGDDCLARPWAGGRGRLTCRAS